MVLMMWGIFSLWSGALIMASTVCILAGSTLLWKTDVESKGENHPKYRDNFAPVPLQAILSFLNHCPKIGMLVHPLKIKDVKKEKDF